MVTLKKEFKMRAKDLEFLAALPDNMPDTKLTGKQEQQIAELYYRYISPIDNAHWGRTLEDIEKAEKWPSGPRMKRTGAQRIVLGFLVNEQRLNGMSDKRAAFHFFSSMQSREAAVKLISHVWNVKPIYK